jgi:hypothetical protein
MSWWLYLALNVKWRIKLLILNLMRLTPRLYLETVRLRPYGQKKPEWVLPPERIAFIEQIRSGNLQPDTVRLSQ